MQPLAMRSALGRGVLLSVFLTEPLSISSVPDVRTSRIVHVKHSKSLILTESKSAMVAKFNPRSTYGNADVASTGTIAQPTEKASGPSKKYA